MEAYHTDLSDGRVEAASEPSFSEDSGRASAASLGYDPAKIHHSPACMNCRFYHWDRDLDIDFCKAHPPDNRKKTPWPVVQCFDLCGGHVYDLTKVADFDYSDAGHKTALEGKVLKCLKPDCPVCGPNGVAASGAARVGAPPAPKAPKESAIQQEFRAAYETLAYILGRPDVPLADVRTVFKDRHRVNETDPKKANKKKLDAWGYALKELPPGFEVDKAGGVIRYQPETPLARAA